MPFMASQFVQREGWFTLPDADGVLFDLPPQSVPITHAVALRAKWPDCSSLMGQVLAVSARGSL